jgi:hypothetical protein
MKSRNTAGRLQGVNKEDSEKTRDGLCVDCKERTSKKVRNSAGCLYVDCKRTNNYEIERQFVGRSQGVSKEDSEKTRRQFV